MKKVTKKALISTCETILQEYEENTHKYDVKYCALCILYYHILDCDDCPMHIFNEGKYGCARRLCFAGDSEEMLNIDINRVIEFYTQTIKWLKTLSVAQINDKNTFKHLIEIDKNAYNKFKN